MINWFCKKKIPIIEKFYTHPPHQAHHPIPARKFSSFQVLHTSQLIHPSNI